MLYFAYGSNMDWEQMRKRCPSSKFVGVAVLNDHRLAFSRDSGRRGCGVADAVPQNSSQVWGVVYEIEDRDVGSLDYHEGYCPGGENNAYRREERHVLLDGQSDAPVAVAVYFALPQESPSLPNQKYKNQIVGGARHWYLPDGYIEKVLEPIEVKSK